MKNKENKHNPTATSWKGEGENATTRSSTHRKKRQGINCAAQRGPYTGRFMGISLGDL